MASFEIQIYIVINIIYKYIWNSSFLFVLIFIVNCLITYTKHIVCNLCLMSSTQKNILTTKIQNTNRLISIQ